MVGDALELEQRGLNEGPFERLLRMRKWLILTAGGLVLIDTGLLDFKSLAATLHVPAASKDQVHFAFSVAAIFQIITLALLTLQLSERYLSSLRNRAPDSRLWAIEETPTTIARTEQTIEEIQSQLGLLLPEDPVTKSRIAEIDRLTSQAAFLRSRVTPMLRRQRWTLVGSEALLDALKLIPTLALFVFATLGHTKLWPIPSIAPPVTQLAPTEANPIQPDPI